MKKAYIYKEKNGYGWFVEEHVSLENAKADCPEDYCVEEYTTVKQLYGFSVLYR